MRRFEMDLGVSESFFFFFFFFGGGGGTLIIGVLIAIRESYYLGDYIGFVNPKP